MARRSEAFPGNAPGAFFVDRSCIDCGTCYTFAPETFADAGDHSVVARQPVSEADRLKRYPASAALYTPAGTPLKSGAHLKNPELAATLRRIADRGRDGFYTGQTASLIVAEMARGKGKITAKDLAGYQPKWRTPVAFKYRNHDVISMPPPSSGGITLALIAQQLEAYDLKALGWHTAPAVHLMAESMRRAFAVRNSALGDPDFIQVDQPALVAPSFSAELRKSIVTDHATPSSEVKGLPAPPEHRQTTHFSVADAEGNAVALTTTINGWYGSAVTVTGAGFLLNNEMDDFAAKPGTPNMYGLVQGEANAIEPGKRMLSAMTPSIVFGTDGKAELITGASGGPFIITTVFQAISNYLDYGLDASALMQAPRMHHQHLPDSLFLETEGFDASVLAALRGYGHTVRDVADVGWATAEELYTGRYKGKRAIFVNGCFWHGHDCKRGARMPKSNADYWSKKIARNRARDARTLAELADIGWRALVVWECELRDEASLTDRLRRFVLGA